jgi:sulfate permease, SulP family
MATPRPDQVASRVFNEAVEGLSDVADYLRHDPVPPLWRELKKYSFAKFKADALAGVTVAVVTIPQAIGFALIVGIPVQAVLITAIIGGLVCAIFSSSHHLVFGPTNTISIIMAGTLVTIADVPLTPLQKVLIIGCIIGVVQIAAGFFKLGNLTHFISRTVIIGYSTAVGLLIIAGQVANLLGVGRSPGVDLPTTIHHIVTRVVLLQLNPMTAAVGISCLLLLIVVRRLRPTWPEGLIALGFFGLAAVVLHLQNFDVPLVRDAGEVAGTIPLFVGFPLNEQGLKLVPIIASAAIATAILGMLEAISIAKTFAARSGQKIDPNRELLGMGAANLAATAFGAMPGSSSFIRSAVNYQSGGKTQLSSVLSSVSVLAIVAVISAFANYIPIAAIAALLIMVAIRLINLEQIRITIRATRSDAVVFWVTLFSALFLRLDTAVYVGIGASLALFLKKASAPSLVEYSFSDSGTLTELEDRAQRRNDAISIVHVEGELFFGAADLFQEQVRYLADEDNIRVIILRMKNARHLDATSVMSLLQLHEYLQKSGRHLLISGISADVERVLQASGAWEKLGEKNIFPAEANLTASTKKALLRASHLLQTTKADVRIFYDRKREKAQDGPKNFPEDKGKLEDYAI